MAEFTGLIERIVNEEDGQGMIEYALIAALLSIAAIAAIMLLGPKVNGIFAKVNTSLGTT